MNRYLGGRIGFGQIPPYNPPFRRAGRYKAWAFGLHTIVEYDVDNKRFELEVYK